MHQKAIKEKKLFLKCTRSFSIPSNAFLFLSFHITHMRASGATFQALCLLILLLTAFWATHFWQYLELPTVYQSSSGPSSRDPRPPCNVSEGDQLLRPSICTISCSLYRTSKVGEAMFQKGLEMLVYIIIWKLKPQLSLVGSYCLEGKATIMPMIHQLTPNGQASGLNDDDKAITIK